jgi:hypothetical protein
MWRENMDTHTTARVTAAQMIRRYREPQWLVEPIGEPADREDVAAINQQGYEVLDRNIRGWGIYNAIVRVPLACAGDVDYLARLATAPRRNCGHCHTCGTPLRTVLDGEEWCPTCQQYRRYAAHGWAGTTDPECPAVLPVYVERIDTIPAPDPYHRDTLGITQTTLVIDPASRTVAVEQDADVGGVTPDRYYTLIVARVIDAHPDADALRSYLTSNEGQSLLARVCDGHSRDWDGSNVVGRLSDDAEEAAAALIAAAESLPETDWTVWDTGDWVDQALPDNLSDLPDEEIDRLVADLEATAAADHVVLSEPIADYVQYQRTH